MGGEGEEEGGGGRGSGGRGISEGTGFVTAKNPAWQPRPPGSRVYSKLEAPVAGEDPQHSRVHPNTLS